VTSSFFFDNLSAGDYTVRSLDTTGCYADTIITIPDGIPIVLSMSNDTIICIDGTAVVSASVSGGTQPYTLNWTGLSGNGPHAVSPTYSQYYKVNVVDSFNCVSEQDSVLVALNPPILLSMSNDSSVCPYEIASVFATANGGNGGPYNYSWIDDNSTVFNPISVGSASNINPNPIDGFTYYFVTVSDNCETPPKTDSVLIDWYDLPTVNFTADTNAGCFPVDVIFSNLTSPSQVATCAWDLGNGYYSNNIDTAITVYSSPGIFDVTLEVTSPEGCVNDTTYFSFIEAYDYPVAGFTARPNPVSILTPTVQFVDTSSFDVVLFEWTFYDSLNTFIGSSFDQNPIFVFSDNIEQNYNIELYVENQYGCSDTVYGVQVVEGQYSLYMPNSFTPNGDGTNDYFFPYGDKIDLDNYKFQIFNRWGEVVFSTTDFNDKWDGQFKGKNVPNDAYLWKIDLKNINTGEYKELKGYVLLTR